MAGCVQGLAAHLDPVAKQLRGEELWVQAPDVPFRQWKCSVWFGTRICEDVSRRTPAGHQGIRLQGGTSKKKGPHTGRW